MKERNFRRGERGVLHVPMAMAFIAITLLMFGAWAILHQWRSLAETQLRLDECVARTALDLRGTLDSLESSNRRVQALRASIVPATLLPPVRAALEAALVAQVAIQEAQRARWQVRRLTWLASGGCGGGDVPSPLPALPVSRLPADEIGPQALSWNPVESLRVELHHSPRHSAAAVAVRGGGKLVGGLLGTEKWSAQWTKPSRLGLAIGSGLR